MFKSEALSRNIRVKVQSRFSPERSNPAHEQWFFLYQITIINESQHTVQLLHRYWLITDANGDIEEVQGPGVVGEQPVLHPGERYEYTSGCPLTTAVGSMQGHYNMVIVDSGETFEAAVAPFTLAEPFAVN